MRSEQMDQINQQRDRAFHAGQAGITVAEYVARVEAGYARSLAYATSAESMDSTASRTARAIESADAHVIAGHVATCTRKHH